MIKEEIKNRILMEMSSVINDSEILKKLKSCIDRNFYGVNIAEECTSLTTTNTISNEDILNRFVCIRSIEGLSINTLSQYKRETQRFFSVVNKSYADIASDDINYYLAVLKKTGISINSIDNARKFIKPFSNGYMKMNIFQRIYF